MRWVVDGYDYMSALALTIDDALMRLEGDDRVDAEHDDAEGGDRQRQRAADRQWSAPAEALLPLRGQAPLSRGSNSTPHVRHALENVLRQKPASWRWE